MEKIGLEAALLDEQFTRAVQAYMGGIDKMNAANAKYVSSATQINSASEGVDLSFSNITEYAGQSAAGMEGLNLKSMALAVTLGNILYKALEGVIGKLKEMISTGIMSAARVEEMDVVLQLIGGRAGYSKTQLDEMVASIVKLGIQTDVAQNTMTQFIRNEWDLADAAKLARAAQDNAVIGMMNSSDALDRMIWAVQTLQPETLRSMGIVIRSDEVYQKYAATNNKLAKELTGTERQQAFLNAVLEESAKNAGAYEISMTTASKQLRSLTRDTWELARVMAEPFLGAFAKVIKTIRDIVEKFRAAFAEGGKFRENMMQIGAVVSLVADKLAEIATRVADWILQVGSGINIIDGIQNAIANLSPKIVILGSVLLGLAGAWLAVKIAITATLTVLKVAEAISGVALAIRAVTSNIGLLLPALKMMFAQAFPALSAMLVSVAATLGLTVGQLLLVAGAVTAVIAVVVALATNVGGCRDKLVAFFKEVGGMAKKAADWIGKAFTDIANWVSSTATKAWNWGVNIVTQFAQGIVSAASSVLTAAMNFIGKILGGWLAPGSPPKVAPDLDKWGMSAVNEWLKGFTQGDWSILESIQAPLQQTFSYLESIGKMTDAGQTFADISKQMIEAMNSGEGFEEVVARIMKDAGAFGPELGTLTNQYFQLSGALAEVTDREKALEAARQKQIDSNKNTNKLIREYNQMLRSGASKDALAAKMKEINASKDAEKAAADQAKQEEDKLKKAKENAIAIQDQIQLQSKLVEMMLKLAEAQTKATPPEEKVPKEPSEKLGKAGAAGLTIPTGGAGAGFEMPSITSGIQDQINSMKEMIKDKLGGIWESLKLKWLSTWLDIKLHLIFAWWDIRDWAVRTWDNIKLKAIEIWTAIKNWFITNWEDLKARYKALWEGIKTSASDIWESIKTKITEVWEGIKQKAIEIWEGIKQWISDKLRELFAALGIDLDDFTARWQEIWDNIKLIISTIWDKIKEAVSTAFNNVKENISTVIESIKTTWSERWNDIKKKVTDIWNDVKGHVDTKINEVKNVIKTVVDDIKLKWDTFWDGIKKKAIDIWEGPDGIKTKIQDAVNTVTGFFTNPEGTGLFDVIGRLAGTIFDKAKEIGSNILEGIKSGIKSAAASLMNGVTGVVEKILNIIMSLLGIASESKVMKKIGIYAMQGWATGIREAVKFPQRAMMDAVGKVMVPFSSTPQSISNVVNKTANINMGGVTINNGMDVAGFRNVIRSVLRSELGGAL